MAGYQDNKTGRETPIVVDERFSREAFCAGGELPYPGREKALYWAGDLGPTRSRDADEVALVAL